MKNLIVLFVCILLVSSCTNHKKAQKLELIKVFEINTNNSLEPSGLTEWDGEFYTVSDKHNAIYQLVFNNNKIDLNLVVPIHLSDGLKSDFEGITHDETNFYLISERQFKILKVSKDGSRQEWLPTEDSIKISGKKAGLFQVENAYLEGICLLKNQKFLLAAERQPRGFIEYDKHSETVAYQVNEPKFYYEKGVSPDFSGLSCHDGIYVLDRNAYTVAELIKINGKFSESRGYSYKHVVMEPEYQYLNMKYGHAEGLVVKGNKIYVILDNNRTPKKSNPHNSNSLFNELEKMI